MYVQDALESCGYECQIHASCRELTRALSAVESRVVVLVQHEYGLFDYHSPRLSGPDTTANVIDCLKLNLGLGKLYQVAIIMHTLVTRDPYYALINKQIFSSGIAVFHLNSQGCFDNTLPYLDHGVPLIPGSLLEGLRAEPTATYSVKNRLVAAFGMLTPNKLPMDILVACKTSGWGLVGCFATDDISAQQRLLNEALALGIQFQFYFDFADEATLLQRLSVADVAISLQERNRHYSTSGSIRFLMNLGIPVLCNPCRQFYDVRSGTLQCDPQSVGEVLSTFDCDAGVYISQARRTVRYALSAAIQGIYLDLLRRLGQRSELGFYRLDHTSCIQGPKGRALSRVSPYKLHDEDAPESPTSCHLDVCLAIALDDDSRFDYVVRSLQLDAEGRTRLSETLLSSYDSVLMMAVALVSLARWKGALTTWGMVEDIQLVSKRAPTPYELVCSGSWIYTLEQLRSSPLLPSHDFSLPSCRGSAVDQLDVLLDLADSLPRSPDELGYPTLKRVFIRSLSLSPLIRMGLSAGSSLSLSVSDVVLQSTTVRLASVHDGWAHD
ncbi:MAG: hypothetical protein VKN13_05295 [Cyanobacteriota bacterium]|nr:hypothetical protein [Cyanobacteriota bacterium]